MKFKRLIQLLVFLLVVSISVGHYQAESGNTIPFLSTASLHAVCPFGGVVSIYEFFVAGKYVKKIHESSFILMIIVFALAVVLGPVFCGWLCPFGTFQEWISKIGKKIFKKRFNKFIPYKVDKYLRFVRYFILLMVVVKTAQSAVLLFANIDPYYALFNIWSDEVAITAYLALFTTIIASLFVERPFCKYMCPYGALLGITNTFKIFKIRRDASTCIRCKICDNKCPMNIPLSNVDVSRNHQCISCLECTSEVSCPKADTMVFSSKNIVLKGKQVGISAILVFVIGIGGSKLLDLWKTESSKVPVKYSTGEFEGEYNPADIRGSYSFQDIERTFNIPIDDLAKAFGLTGLENLANFKIKSFEEMFSFDEGIEVGTDSMRLFVSLYNSVPYTPETTTRLLRSANSVLKDRITEEQKVELSKILIDSPNAGDATISHDEEPSDELIIKGKTTFNEAINLGLSESKIIEVIGIIPKNLNMTIRDYAVENNLEFSVIKESLLLE